MTLTTLASLTLGNAAEDYVGKGKEVLSDGGTTITWTISTDRNGWIGCSLWDMDGVER